MKTPIDASPSDYAERALRLVDQQFIMTLATAASNQAWAAPVYYVFHTAEFFFFSKPESTHIEQGLVNEQVGASIHPFAETWQGIRGIQMNGRITPVRPGMTAVRVIRAYLAKFPFVQEFFDEGQMLDLIGFSRRFRVKLYRFTPLRVYYLDNEVRFGFRTEVALA